MTDPRPSLSLSRLIAAPRQRVFAACTQPEWLRQWLAPGDLVVTEIEADARVGGRYRFTMEGGACGPDGRATVAGAYTEIVPQERVRFTWQLGDGSPETLVTFELRDVPGGTELSIHHQGFPDALQRDRHQHGWLGCLDKLAHCAPEPLRATPAERSADLGPRGPQVGVSTSGARAAGALGPAPTMANAAPRPRAEG